MAATGGQTAAAVARVYAHALSRLAVANGEEQQWLEALHCLSAASQSPAWRELLATPGYTRRQRASKLTSLAGDALSAKAALLAQTLAAHNRLNQVAAIERAFVDQLDLLHNRRKVLVQCAHPLAKPEQQQLQAALAQHFDEGGKWTLSTEYQVVPELLEGIVATCGDKRLDASVLGQLSRLQTAMAAP